MTDVVMGGLSAAVSLLALFGGIALLMWIDSKRKVQERQLAHIERLKALDLNQPLPDAEVARHEAEASRVGAAGAVAILVPLGLAGVAVGATALVFAISQSPVHLPLLCVIWGICGLVGLIAVIGGVETIRQWKAYERKDSPPAVTEGERRELPPTGIREKQDIAP